MRKQFWMWGCAAALATAVVGCATAPSDVDVSRQAAAVLKSSFKANGQAGLDRLDQDDTQRLCTQYANKPLPKDVAAPVAMWLVPRGVQALTLQALAPVNTLEFVSVRVPF